MRSSKTIVSFLVRIGGVMKYRDIITSFCIEAKESDKALVRSFVTEFLSWSGFI